MYKQLISEQRYTIFILLQQGIKKKDIAAAINVHPSTITREIKRNSGKRGIYNWKRAQSNSIYRKRRNPGNRTIKKETMSRVIDLLVTEQWSPKQISGTLALEGISISHETIYKIIRKDKSHGGDLYKNCRHRLKHRKRPVSASRCFIPNRISIDERPKEANGSRFGDFEMDTIVGKNGSGAIVTLVERNTNMLSMRKLDKGKNANALAMSIGRSLFCSLKDISYLCCTVKCFVIFATYVGVCLQR